jgi:hypothetical protein
MRTSGTTGLGTTDLSRPLTTSTGRAVGLSSAAAQPLSVAQARENVRAAAADLIAAIRSLTTETRPVFSTTTVIVPPTAPLSRGIAARLNPVLGAYSILRATERVNTRVDTSRSSTAPIGLDLSTPQAASVLRSSALGLDITSPTAASQLRSSASLGLDLTSPDAASSLRSSAAMGLDLSNEYSVLSSSSTLGLDVTSPQASSTLVSTAEINTNPTSLADNDLTFTSSTSHAQISGSYTGAATALTIKINVGGTIGGLPIFNISFQDQNGNSLGSHSGGISAGQVIDVGSTGLKVRFTAGSLSTAKSATTAISQTDTSVSGTAAFNAGWGTAPAFEDYGTVSAGSFTVNGASITVAATDSINSVLAKINASAAGVTASLSGDKITLTSNANSEDNIVLGSDTSGFLAATKLTGATTTRGNIRDDEQVLAKTSQFASVATGSFTINGVSISVNKNTDSVASIVSRINSANAGVTATYDTAADRLVLTAASYGADQIVVSNDTTGFLSAAHLSTNNTVRGRIQDDQATLSATATFGAVTNGSFIVDGQVITVATTDSLDDIIERINASSARVIASYDSIDDTIVLDALYASEDDVPIGGDTSGFLAAANLSAGNTEPGNIRDDLQVFAKAPQFTSVTSGSFTINGTTITLDADADSVSTIVDKINAANAGVTASYDADQILLVGAGNSEDLIEAANDTTGFLAAANLASANTERGNLRDDEQVLAKTSQFGTATSGSFTINGQDIAVDVDADSVATLVDRINDANAGVTAVYDSGSDKIVLTSTANSEDDIDVANDTTGFAALAGLITSNTERGNIRDDEQILSKTSQFAAVATGAFEVNGVSISVDASLDSLQTLITRINASNAGVTASYDGNTDVLSFTPDVAGATLSLDNDTSGFLAATHVTEGTIGTRLNIDAAFDATGRDAPLFDDGLSVHAGTFEVNGVMIGVADGDSVQSVLERITESAAAVTATFDENTQTVSLTNTTRSADLVTVANDTSGFLAAMKIDGTASSTAGKADVEALDATLDTMAEYSGVHAGTLTINDHDIAIDPSTTTISSLMNAINDIENVAATLDERTGLLSVVGRGNDRMLTTADTSGLLAALGMAQGAIQGARGRTSTVTTETGTETVTNAGAVSVRVAAAIDKLNAALAQVAQLRTMSPETNRQVEAAIRTALSLIASAGVEGLTVKLGPPMRIEFSASRIAESLAKHAESLPSSLAVDAELRIALSPNRAAADAAATADTRSSIISRAVSQFAAAQAANQRLLLNATFSARLPAASPVSSNETAANAYRSLETTTSSSTTKPTSTSGIDPAND